MRNFKLFLRSSVVFALLIIIISTVLTYPYFYGEAFHYQDGYVRDSLAGKIDYVVLGASQAQRGISPAVIDAQTGSFSYNLGTPLMTFQGKYEMLKKEIKRNPIKTVVIEVCYDSMVRDRDNVGPEGDYYMLGRFTNPVERFSYFLKSARISEYADFYYDALDRGIKAWKKYDASRIGSSENYHTKGFAPLPSEPVEMILQEDFGKEEILTEISSENEYYLDKIFKLCRENDIHTVMVSTPLSDSAILSYDKLDVINDYYKSVAEKWNIKFYNFSLYKGKSEMFPDAGAYIDRNHIGESAAEEFTKLMIKTITENQDTDKLFYKTYSEYYDTFKE